MNFCTAVLIGKYRWLLFWPHDYMLFCVRSGIADWLAIGHKVYPLMMAMAMGCLCLLLRTQFHGWILARYAQKLAQNRTRPSTSIPTILETNRAPAASRPSRPARPPRLWCWQTCRRTRWGCRRRPWGQHGHDKTSVHFSRSHSYNLDGSWVE